MQRMKVLLVALNAKYVHSNLAVYDIEAYAKKNSTFVGELGVREYTINQNLDSILQLLYKEKADVLAFSCYIWNIREILSITKGLKKIQSSLSIWLGGPEVSFHSQTLLEQQPHIDGIMVGEGEETFAEFLSCLEKKEELLPTIKGLLYRTDAGEIICTGTRKLISMDAVPFIYEDLSSFQNKILYYESSRGCPFSCSYCLSSIDKTVRFRSLSVVEEELQKFLDAKVAQVKFIDRTFNCKKDRALAIWNYITKHDNGITNFHFEISADLIGEEELAIFKQMRPGLIQLEIGLQSTHPETIKEIRRIMDISKLRSNMLTIRSYGNIHQHLDLIAGLPYEDYETFQKSFNDAYAMQPHQLQLGFLKVLKGSHMETMCEEYGILYHDEQPYEVMCTKWISYEEILKLKQVEEMVEVYHNSGQFENALSYLLTFFEDAFSFFYKLGEFYESHDLYGIGFRREARYEALRDFAQEYVSSMRVFDDLLTYDYYLRENAKTRPSWAKEEPIPKEIFQNFFRSGGNALHSLVAEGEKYDAKTTSRKMHVEPVSYEAFTKIHCLHGENKVCGKPEEVYCLFDYDERNAFSKDAKVVFLEDL